MALNIQTAPMKYKDPTTGNYVDIIGVQGPPGSGISSITKTGTSGVVDTYTITFDNTNTSTFTVTNGSSISSIAKTGTSGLVDTYTVTLSNGNTSTFEVRNGVTPSMTIGTVDVGTAAASISGTAESPVLSLTLPRPGVDDVQINGTSIISSGVANIPKATDNSGSLGVVGTEASFGIRINSSGKLYTDTPSSTEIKAGTQSYKPITPVNAYSAAFYGLAKAAGDTTQSASSNAVGTYTSGAKAAIKAMLGIEGGMETYSVSGTTPTITAVANTRYVCGEVSTISITPPALGATDVVFTSGSSAAILTIPATVKFPVWFDATALETDTIYEICITDGIYGSVMTWPNS